MFDKRYWADSGKTRRVLIVPELGIVLKFAIIHWAKLGELLRRHPECLFSKKYWNPYCELSPGHFLLMGFYANWTEWWFWLKTRHSFVQPTWFSFLGIVNIQPISDNCPDSLRAMKFTSSLNGLGAIAKEITGEDWTRLCGHEFVDLCNLGLYRGRLRFRDYGGWKIQSFLGPHGQRMAEVLFARFGF